MGSRLPEQPSSRPLRHRRRTLRLIEAASVATPPLASRSRRRMGSCACGRKPCGDIGRPMRRLCVARLARGRRPGGSGSTSRSGGWRGRSGAGRCIRPSAWRREASGPGGRLASRRIAGPSGDVGQLRAVAPHAEKSEGSSLPMIGDLGYNAGRGDPRGRESHGS
jgi:hypothetical protein